MYRRILLAYDGSLEGAVALREGALLARKCQARVFVLCAVPEEGGLRMAEAVQAGPVAHQMKTYSELLERGCDRLRRLGVELEARLCVGEPVKAIAAYAREKKVDLVVVGHRRRSMLERWWSGPSGAYLSDHIGCTLLIARNQVSDEAFDAAMAKAEVV